MAIRTEGIKKLQSIYETGSNNMVLVTGTLRSAQDSLLKVFAKDKSAFYFSCSNASDTLQLKLLENAVSQQYYVTFQEHSYAECFKNLRFSGSSKHVIIIDEFQRLSLKNQEFFDALLELKSGKLLGSPVMIILSTESLTLDMEGLGTALGGNPDNVLDDVIRATDYSFLELVQALPEYQQKDAVAAYSIIGGTPDYLTHWNQKQSVKENVIRLILRKGGYLYDEAENYIRSELREISVYSTILYSMASGHEKLNDLYNDTGYSRAKISVYLKNLAAFDVIEKVVSFDTGGWKNAKKGIYQIKNNFINFWFHFIYANMSALKTMSEEAFYDRYIAPGLADYTRRYMIDVCREYIEILNKMNRLPVRISKSGTWIGKQGTIDYIGHDTARRTVTGFCNRHHGMLTMDDLSEFKNIMEQARVKACAVYLFSAEGFSTELKGAAAADSSIVLVDMNEL